MRRFIVDSMKTTEVNSDHAAQLADLLIAADQRGHYSHGLNRLHIYVNDVASGSNAKDGNRLLFVENIEKFRSA